MLDRIMASSFESPADQSLLLAMHLQSDRAGCSTAKELVHATGLDREDVMTSIFRLCAEGWLHAGARPGANGRWEVIYLTVDPAWAKEESDPASHSYVPASYSIS